MQIEKTDFRTLKESVSIEDGLVILGAGGSLEEWVNGVTKMLLEENIATSGDPSEVWSKFYVLTTTGGRTDLVLMFPKNKDVLHTGKLAMWRLKFGDASWLSDYFVNYANQHGIEEDHESVEESNY